MALALVPALALALGLAAARPARAQDPGFDDLPGTRNGQPPPVERVQPPSQSVGNPADSAPVPGSADDDFAKVDRQEMEDFYSYDLHMAPLRRRAHTYSSRYSIIDSRFDPYHDTVALELRKKSPNAAAVLAVMCRDAVRFRPRGGMPTFFNVNTFLDTALKRWNVTPGAPAASPGGGAPSTAASPAPAARPGAGGATEDLPADALASLAAARDLETDGRYTVTGYMGLQDFVYQQKAMGERLFTGVDAVASSRGIAAFATPRADPMATFKAIREFMLVEGLPAPVQLPGSNEVVLVCKVIQRDDGVASLHIWRPLDSVHDLMTTQALRQNVIHLRVNAGTLEYTPPIGSGGDLKAVTELGRMYKAIDESLRGTGILGGFSLSSVPTLTLWSDLFSGSAQKEDEQLAGATWTIFWGNTGPFAPPFGNSTGGAAAGLRPPITDFPRPGDGPTAILGVDANAPAGPVGTLNPGQIPPGIGMNPGQGAPGTGMPGTQVAVLPGGNPGQFPNDPTKPPGTLPEVGTPGLPPGGDAAGTPPAVGQVPPGMFPEGKEPGKGQPGVQEGVLPQNPPVLPPTGDKDGETTVQLTPVYPPQGGGVAGGQGGGVAGGGDITVELPPGAFGTPPVYTPPPGQGLIPGYPPTPPKGQDYPPVVTGGGGGGYIPQGGGGGGGYIPQGGGGGYIPQGGGGGYIPQGGGGGYIPRGGGGGGYIPQGGGGGGYIPQGGGGGCFGCTPRGGGGGGYIPQGGGGGCISCPPRGGGGGGYIPYPQGGGGGFIPQPGRPFPPINIPPISVSIGGGGGYAPPPPIYYPPPPVPRYTPPPPLYIPRPPTVPPITVWTPPITITPTPPRPPPIPRFPPPIIKPPPIFYPPPPPPTLPPPPTKPPPPTLPPPPTKPPPPTLPPPPTIPPLPPPPTKPPLPPPPTKPPLPPPPTKPPLPPPPTKPPLPPPPTKPPLPPPPTKPPLPPPPTKPPLPPPPTKPPLPPPPTKPPLPPPPTKPPLPPPPTKPGEPPPTLPPVPTKPVQGVPGKPDDLPPVPTKPVPGVPGKPDDLPPVPTKPDPGVPPTKPATGPLLYVAPGGTLPPVPTKPLPGTPGKPGDPGQAEPLPVGTPGLPPLPTKPGQLPPTPKVGPGDPGTAQPGVPPVAGSTGATGVTGAAPVSQFIYLGKEGREFSTKPVEAGAGLFRILGYPYNIAGVNEYGYNWDGYRAVEPGIGFDPWGYDPYGFDSEGYDPWGFDRRGYDHDGKNIGDCKGLLALRSYYIEDPFRFRLAFNIGPTGDVTQISNGRVVWPTGGLSHPYTKKDTTPATGLTYSPYGADPTLAAQPPAPFTGSTGTGAAGTAASGTGPAATGSTGTAAPTPTPQPDPGALAAAPTVPAAPGDRGSDATLATDAVLGLAPVTIGGRVTNLDDGYLVLRSPAGQYYVQPTGEAPVPLGSSIDPDQDFQMVKISGTWTFRQSAPIRRYSGGVAATQTR